MRRRRVLQSFIAVVAMTMASQTAGHSYDYGTFYPGCSPVGNVLKLKLVAGDSAWTTATSPEAVDGATDWEGVTDHTGNLVVDIQFPTSTGSGALPESLWPTRQITATLTV